MHIKICLRPFLQPVSVYFVDIISCSHSLTSTLPKYHLTCCSSVFLHTCCSPFLPTSPHSQFIVGMIHLFLMFTCDSLFASFQSALQLPSAFRWRNVISHFLLWSHYLSISLHSLTVTCWIFSTVSFLFRDK